MFCTDKRMISIHRIMLNALTGAECPTNSSFCELLYSFPNLPRRGPRNRAAKKEQTPPVTWMGPQPEKST
jgi:hypothetical protein